MRRDGGSIQLMVLLCLLHISFVQAWNSLLNTTSPSAEAHTDIYRLNLQRLMFSDSLCSSNYLEMNYIKFLAIYVSISVCFCWQQEKHRYAQALQMKEKKSILQQENKQGSDAFDERRMIRSFISYYFICCLDAALSKQEIQQETQILEQEQSM